MKDTEALEVLVRAAGNQRKLAKAIGITETHVSRMMHGIYPVPEHLIALGEAMALLHQRDWPARWKR
jgi:DNA-binding transcriptional regulator YdaS (Cro superfamily)